ncbi:hypothetical protein ACWEKR_06145 [Nocardia sp. NPDC004573]
MSRFLKFFLIDKFGHRWNLTDETEGVLLRPGPSKLIDAPARTFWLESSTGSHYQGMKFDRRDPVFSVQIHNPDPLVWADIDSRFRMGLGMVGEDTFTMEAHSPYGIRRIQMRLLMEPTAYASEEYEKYDPWLTRDSTLAISAACERPFWEADPIPLEWEPSAPNDTGTLMWENRGDVPVWWRGFANAPGRYRVPDRSWGQKIYAKSVYPFHRADDDAVRMEWLPEIFAGEDLSIETDPDLPTLIAANGAPVQNRWGSRGLLYPIAPGTLPTPVTVQAEGVSPGGGIKFWLPRWFSRPWGVTL